VALGAVALVALALRLATCADFPEGLDSVLFLRGLERYELRELRPHWPGYPVYLWAGWLFLGVLGEPVRALHVLSCVASALCALPLAALTALALRELGASEPSTRLGALGAAALWAVLPLPWLDGSEIFSDPLAMLVALCQLQACAASLRPQASPTRPLLVAAVLGGLMLGVRLSYVALLLPLALATWRSREALGRWRGLHRLPLCVAGAFGAAVLCWLLWQLAMEGAGLIEAARRHLSGHFSHWGGSVTTDRRLSSRPLRLLETLGVYGLGTWWPGTPLHRLPATVLWVALAGLGLTRLAPLLRRPLGTLLLAWAGPYLVWSVLAHDVDLARYTFPLVAALCLVAGVAMATWRPLLASVVAVASVAAVAVVSAPLARANGIQRAPEAQLVHWLQEHVPPGRSALLLADASYLIPLPGLPEAIPAEPGNLALKLHALQGRGRAIYTTSTSLASLGAPTTGWREVARFHQDRFVQSRGPWELVLYRYAP
jgi:hypothetical protein